MPHFHLMGYCLGGTLATIFTALYPSVVKDLVLMSAPIDLDGDNTLLKAWANQDCFDVDLFIDAFGNCPGIFLRSFFALLDPVRNLYGKFGDLAGRMHDEEFVESFVALQQWANAQVSVVGEVFRDVVKLLYQRNLLARGQLVIEGAPVRLDRISCAVLLLTATADQLVTPLSTMGLVPRICSRDVKSMSLEGGHESLAVSSKAHQTFWPEAAQWIADHSTPRTGPWIRPGESASGRPEFVFAEKVDPASKCSRESTG
jgi:polyhydroxyalkanoate synthase